jgi:NADH-quinone oxidoreductase subunit N
MKVGGDDISNLNGLARRNTGLAVLMALFVLSLAGIPPLSGFFAKFYIFMAGWQSGAHWLVVVAVIATIVSLYYYLRLLRAIFIAAPESEEPVATPPAINATLILSALLVIALGVYPNLVLTVIERVQLVAGL